MRKNPFGLEDAAATGNFSATVVSKPREEPTNYLNVRSIFPQALDGDVEVGKCAERESVTSVTRGDLSGTGASPKAGVRLTEPRS
jgi:hypothetical protein